MLLCCGGTNCCSTVSVTSLIFAPMIRLRKKSANPFTASQFRIDKPNAISFSTHSTCELNFKLNQGYRLSNFLSALNQSSSDWKSNQGSSESSCRLCGRRKTVSTVNLSLHSRICPFTLVSPLGTLPLLSNSYPPVFVLSAAPANLVIHSCPLSLPSYGQPLSYKYRPHLGTTSSLYTSLKN